MTRAKKTTLKDKGKLAKPEAKPEETEERITETKPEEKITVKQSVTIKRPEKHSWLKYEAPDKNGKKIEVYFGKAKIMKEKLLEQDEVITFIPRTDGEAVSVPQIVNLNGYKLNIPKNTYVSLPMQIAETIRKSHAQVEAAYAEINASLGINRDDKSIQALS